MNTTLQYMTGSKRGSTSDQSSGLSLTEVRNDNKAVKTTIVTQPPTTRGLTFRVNYSFREGYFMVVVFCSFLVLNIQLSVDKFDACITDFFKIILKAI